MYPTIFETPCVLDECYVETTIGIKRKVVFEVGFFVRAYLYIFRIKFNSKVPGYSIIYATVHE